MLELLLLAGAAVAMLLGIVPRGAAIGFIVMVLAWCVAGPLVDAFVSLLPLWAQILVGFLFLYWIVAWVARMILGEHVAGEVLGRAVWNLLALPFRALGALLGLVFRRPA